MTEHRQINDLKPHPQNNSIYGDSFDKDLLDSIRTYGMDTPVKITADSVIISGHRRWAACKYLGFETIPVQEIEESDPDKLIELLIVNNIQREKSHAMKAREFKALKVIEEKRAKARMLEGKNQYSPVENLPQAETGKSRDKAAAKVGWSGRTAEQAEDVIDHIDSIQESEPEKAAELTETLNKSVSAASKEIKPQKKRQKQEVNKLSIVSEEMEKAFDAFIKLIAKAKKEKWKTTSKEKIFQYSKQLTFYLGE